MDNSLSAALLSGEQELVSPKEAKLLAKISAVRVVTEDDLLAEEVHERQRASERIASDVNKIHECFSDIQSLVSQQSETVTLIEDDIESAHSNTENGRTQIKKAANHQKQGFKCCVIALATIAGILALIAVAVSLYTKFAI
jgi:t-SNARE complex subunit (syntaxin)